MTLGARLHICPSHKCLRKQIVILLGQCRPSGIIMTFDITSISNIVDICEGVGLITVLWYLINLKPKMKVEKAQADLASAEADGKVGDNWAHYAEKQDERIAKQDEKIEKLERLVEEYKKQKDEMEADFKEREKSYQETIAKLQGLVDDLTKVNKELVGNNEELTRQVNEMKELRHGRGKTS